MSLFSPLTAINNFVRFNRDPLLFTEQIHKNVGDNATVYLGHKRFHFMYTPNEAEHLLIRNANNYPKSRLIFDKIMPITGRRGLVQLESQTWQEWRRRTGEMFTREALLAYPDIMQYYLSQIHADFARSAATNTPLDIHQVFISYAMRSAVKIFLGIQNDDYAHAIANDFIELNHRCGTRMRRLFNPPKFFTSSRRIIQLQNRLRERLKEIIVVQPHNHNSLLAKLSITKNCDEIDMICDQLMTFLFAGFETTAASLTFCFYLLAKHPDVQNTLKAELEREHKNYPRTLDDFKRLPYANAVYREALRLFPPAWILAREALSDDQINGRRIERGDSCLLSVHGIHRRADLWPHAETYLPERFLENANTKLSTWRTKKCAFLPFGAGPRICSGTQLASLEAINALAHLCSKYWFFLDDDRDLALTALVTLNPATPVFIRVRHYAS